MADQHPSSNQPGGSQRRMRQGATSGSVSSHLSQDKTTGANSKSRKRQRSGLKRKSAPEASSIPEKSLKKGSKTVISDLTFSAQSSSSELKVAIEKVHRTSKDSQQTSASKSKSLPSFQTSVPGPSKNLSSSASKQGQKRSKQSKSKNQEESDQEEEEEEINITPHSLRSYSRTHPYRFQSLDYYAPRRLSRGGISAVFETSPGKVLIPESQSLPSVSGLGTPSTQDNKGSEGFKAGRTPKSASDSKLKGEVPTTSGVQTRRQSEPTGNLGKTKRKATTGAHFNTAKGKSSSSKGDEDVSQSSQDESSGEHESSSCTSSATGIGVHTSQGAQTNVIAGNNNTVMNNCVVNQNYQT